MVRKPIIMIIIRVAKSYARNHQRKREILLPFFLSFRLLSATLLRDSTFHETCLRLPGLRSEIMNISGFERALRILNTSANLTRNKIKLNLQKEISKDKCRDSIINIAALFFRERFDRSKLFGKGKGMKVSDRRIRERGGREGGECNLPLMRHST